MNRAERQSGPKQGARAILATLMFFIIILSIVATMNVKNTRDLRGILEDSVKSQLISISVAAREIVDVDAFIGYNGEADIRRDQEAYDKTLASLRLLADEVGAEYIYALKQIDGAHFFVFDTDTENEDVFIEYDLSPVHEDAFRGIESADVMNVVDEYGSFNTGAVPIFKDGTVVGIISADIEDSFLSRSNAASTRNASILAATLAVSMAVMLYVVLLLMRRVGKMQKRLEHIAHYDTVTGLPNRQFLLDYLLQTTEQEPDEPFALLFIDVDNFKQVNDNAGHDAGDELLRHIAAYLESAHENAMAFRPAAGILNIAARIGGDEFIQVMSGITTEAEAAAVAKNLLDGFESQITDRYIQKYGVGLSVGVALYPFHTQNFHVLIKYADIAMYNAKHAGKNSYRVYTDEMRPTGEK